MTKSIDYRRDNTMDGCYVLTSWQLESIQHHCSKLPSCHCFAISLLASFNNDLDY